MSKLKNSTTLAALGLHWAGLVNIPPPWAANIDYSEMSHDTDPTPDTNTNNMQYSTVQYSTVQYSTVQYSTQIPHLIPPPTTCTALYSAVLYFTALYCTVLHCTCCEARLYTSEALRPRSWSQAATGPGNTVSWAGGGAGNSGEASGSTASYLQNRVIQWAW